MKNYLLVFLALVVTSFTSLSAQTEKPLVKAQAKEALPAPAFLKAVPTTNIVTLFSAGRSEADTMTASWVFEGSRLRLTGWYGLGETNLLSLEVSSFATEKNFDWQAGGESASGTFPEGTEKLWIAFTQKIRARYQVIGGGIFVETSPLKYMGKIERLTDGVILTQYLFGDVTGKYRTIDEVNWAGAVPEVNQTIYLGSNDRMSFPVEKSGEKFLLTLEVVTDLERDRKEQERMFGIGSRSAAKEEPKK